MPKSVQKSPEEIEKALLDVYLAKVDPKDIKAIVSALSNIASGLWGETEDQFPSERMAALRRLADKYFAKRDAIKAVYPELFQQAPVSDSQLWN
jgi:hypothetical protein